MSISHACTRVSGLASVSAFLLLLPMSAIHARAQAAPSPAQPDSASASDLAARLADKVDRLERQLETTQHELEEYRGEVTTLRRQVDAMSAPHEGSGRAGQAEESERLEDASALRQAVADLREEQAVQQSEIAVHEQSKVETLSRYNLKIGGLVLFNTFQNIGSVDNIEVPALALPRAPGASHGSSGASLRQSLITLDATGPQFWGAHTYANVQMDFFGSLSTADYTSTAGSVRMRAASILTEWPGWRVHGGLERLLIAPSSPTSYATIGEPAMSWSGNLWAWVPQLTAEKLWNVNDSRQFSLSAALVDVPDPGPTINLYDRTASAAEASRWPGSEARIGYAWGAGRVSRVGAGGYFSPHDYGQFGSVDAWAATGDWDIALPARLFFSGDAYKGQALGGLGGGAFKDVIYPYSYSQVNARPVPVYARAYAEAAPAPIAFAGLRDAGGWTQLKYKPASRFELNGAFGLDNATAAQLRMAAFSAPNQYTGLVRNQTFLTNAIFRPRASFLLSVEYRKLRSWQIDSTANDASTVGLAAGYEF